MTAADTDQVPQQPGLLARSYASAQLVWKLKHYIPTVATTAFRYYTTRDFHESWPLGVACFVALARYSSESARAQRALNPDRPIDVVRETQNNRKRIEAMIVGAPPKNGAIDEVAFTVHPRQLGGVLEDADRTETGERQVKAEWSVHGSLLSENAAQTEKVLLYLHGGAYCLLSPKTHRPLCMQLSKALNCRVFSVDYRLSPETKFPGALHDAVSAYFHLTRDLGIPASNIYVGGDSAGGNLAVALLLYLRDSDLPRLAGGVLLSPWVDFTSSFESWDLNASSDYIAIDRDDPLVPMPLFARSDQDLVHPYVSPSIVGSLEGLPPLIVLAGGSETLRDEITMLVHRAAADGVEVRHEVYEGGVHVFVAVMERGMGKKAIENIATWASNLNSTSQSTIDAIENRTEWDRIGDRLKADYTVKQEKDTKTTRSNPARPESERFVYEEMVEDAPRVKLRDQAHPEARKALEELSKNPPRSGITTIVRTRKNPEYNGGILGRLHL
ncbi:alpha/beta hydrolase [Sporobolomyces koalae]|uniref:alpha/beta hydrolase n=1 Tax=Sporobolomyces koalae TaxID=500713 RepID=UPI00316C5837